MTVLDWFRDLSPIVQALVAGGATWLLTTVGAAVVVLSGREPSSRWLAVMLGFASGVMIAASFWSLLAPAIDLAAELGVPEWLPAAVGFVAGAGALRLADLWLPHLHPRGTVAEGRQTAWQRSTLLVLAITLHNIPEGLAVGVAFGALAGGVTDASSVSLAGAVSLAIGIGLQNVPEGAAVAMPLRGAGLSKGKALLAGSASALVEPLAAVAGAAAVTRFRPILPYALAFAAGAMIFVVAEELIPDAQRDDHGDLATGALIVGFTVMMVLDVALG